jgi:hypothetical protein
MRTPLVAVLAVAVVALSVAVALLVREPREQGRELARLTECVSTLERNQVSPQRTPEGELLISSCPLYN